MNTVLWMVQVLLAIVFFMAGAMKVMQPREKLVTNWGWIDDFSVSQVNMIGFLEILGARSGITRSYRSATHVDALGGGDVGFSHGGSIHHQSEAQGVRLQVPSTWS